MGEGEVSRGGGEWWTLTDDYLLRSLAVVNRRPTRYYWYWDGLALWYTYEGLKWELKPSVNTYRGLTNNPHVMKTTDPRFDPDLLMPEGF